VSSDSDEADWEQTCAGDGDAFGRIFDRYRQRLYRHSYRLVPDRADADDVVAIAFFEAWRRRDSARFVDGSILPWLLVIATNSAHNVSRSARRYRALLAKLPAPHRKKHPMKPETASPRDNDLRRMLVATADLTPLIRTRPSRRVVVACVAAFALAGALTGGALAVSAAGKAPSTATEFDVQYAAQRMAAASDGTLLGTPTSVAAGGQLQLPLIDRPSGANNLVIGFECQEAGKFTTRLDSKIVATETCYLPPTVSNGVGDDGVTQSPQLKPGDAQRLTLPTNEASAILLTTTDHSTALTFGAPGDRQFTVWISWVRIPKLTPSAAEKAELADGVITRAEYLAAFDRLVGCMTASGHPLTDIDESGETVSFSFDSLGDPVIDADFNRCFETEDALVREMWLKENP
jgi:DNA-directed RNA polymerase specialized sigma24 family protein